MVVLPAPLPPSKAVQEPAAIEKRTAATAVLAVLGLLAVLLVGLPYKLGLFCAALVALSLAALLPGRGRP